MAKTRSKKKIVRSILGSLKRKYGSSTFPEKKDPTEALLLWLIARDVPMTPAKRCLKGLKEEYVDWNDLRVSNVPQIMETLEKRDLEPVMARRMAERIKKTLQTIWLVRNDPNLDGLKGKNQKKKKKKKEQEQEKGDQEEGEEEEEKEKGPEEFLEDLHQLEPWTREFLVLALDLDRLPPLDPATDRVLERVGIFEIGQGWSDRRDELRGLVNKKDARVFHHLMIEHGKKTCHPADPACDRCDIRDDCAYGQEKPTPEAAPEPALAGK